MSKFLKTALSGGMALSLMLTPILAFADGAGGIIQLKPMTNTGDDVTTTNTGYNNTGYGLGNGYYNNDTISLRGRVVSIPQGTLLMVRTDQSLTSYGTHIGDPVSATLENDIFVNDSVAIPAGSQILGQVANVDQAGHLGTHGSVDIRFNAIKLSDGKTIPIRAHIVTTDETGVLKGDTYTKDVLKGVGIAVGGTGVGTLMGTAAGSLMGSVAGGALFGLGVGALGGMGYALARKGKEVVVPAQSRMSLIIDQPVTVGN